MRQSRLHPGVSRLLHQLPSTESGWRVHRRLSLLGRLPQARLLRAHQLSLRSRSRRREEERQGALAHSQQRPRDLSAESHGEEPVLLHARTDTLLRTELSTFATHSQALSLPTLRRDTGDLLTAVLSEPAVDPAHTANARPASESILHSGKHGATPSSGRAEPFDLAAAVLRVLSLDFESHG